MIRNEDLQSIKDEVKILRDFVVKLQNLEVLTSNGQVLVDHTKAYVDDLTIQLENINISISQEDIKNVNDLVSKLHDTNGVTTPEGKVLLEQIRAQADTITIDLKMLKESENLSSGVKTGNKLFSVSTSPVVDGTFCATFTGLVSLVNYIGGAIKSGVWDFGDGQTMKYNGQTPFTHHGYVGDKIYNVKLSITESNHTLQIPLVRYITKTINIGSDGKQFGDTLKTTEVQ
jgi:hypothetical protein